MSAEELDRVTALHMQIRKAARSSDRKDEALWELLEKLAQEVMILKAQVESEPRPFRPD